MVSWTVLYTVEAAGLHLVNDRSGCLKIHRGLLLLKSLFFYCLPVEQGGCLVK